MPSSEIAWLTHDEFMVAFEKPPEPVRLQELVTCEVSFEEAKSLIPAEPLHEPPDTKWRYPGPIAEWYGKTQGLLLIMTAHTTDHLKILEIAIQPDRKPFIAWQQISNLKALPAQFLQSINWVKSARGMHSFAIEAERNDVRYEMFFGEKEECVELEKQLKSFDNRLKLEVIKLAQPCELP